MAHWGAILSDTLAEAGVVYTLLAAWVVARFGWGQAAKGVAEPVSLLKPLYGDEPCLQANLASFFAQDWDAPIEMVAGIQRADDPARAHLEVIRHSREGGNFRGEGGALAVGDPSFRRDDAVVEVVDATAHGANAKISNLINLYPAASHDLLVLSDSDMVAPRDYLATLAGALARPGVGAVTCVYGGRGDAGVWSEVAAGGISYHFIPQLLIGLRLGLAKPGMGSTIALRRATLEAIGGFRRFADSLADDYELGAAVRGLGLTVAVPPMLLLHGCTERSLRDVWRHELRWSATILAINPGGQIGTILTYPVPMALIAACFSLQKGAIVLGAAMLARLLLKHQVDRAAARFFPEGEQGMRWWFMPFRDCLLFATYVAAFFVRSVDWRGQHLTMQSRGRIAADPE